MFFGRHAGRLMHELYEQDPLEHCSDLALYYHNLGVSLHSAARFKDACVEKAEAVKLQGQLCNHLNL